MRDLVVRDNIFDALGANHHTLAKIKAPGGVQQFAFAPDSREAPIAHSLTLSLAVVVLPARLVEAVSVNVGGEVGQDLVAVV